MSSPYTIPPAGTSALSFFVPATIVDAGRPPGILADKVDPATGEIVSLFYGLDPVDAAVIFQWRNSRHLFKAIKKNDDDATDAMRFLARRIFQPFIDAKLVELGSVVVRAGSGNNDEGDLFVEYRNLHTGATEKVPV